MGLLQQVQDLFKTSNLYEVLGVPKSASEAEVRQGYYKTSLTVHPDRAPEDEQATVKFQALGKVYAVLSDKDQRAVYDEQGIVDEESDSLQDPNRNWEEYWRTMFPKITLQDILDFEKSYKHTDEEKQDLKRVYEESQGDMNKIMESVLCASQEDEARFRDILQAAIDAGELTAYTGFTHESASRKKSRKRKAQKEEKEAEQMQKDMGMTSDSSLVAMIQRKQQANQTGFNSLISNLEDKYCKKKKPRASTAKKGKK